MKNVQKLSDTEMELMKVIWECDPPVTSTELLHIFAGRGKEWKAQTDFYLLLAVGGQRSAQGYGMAERTSMFPVYRRKITNWLRHNMYWKGYTKDRLKT